MPLTANKIHNFDVELIREPKQANELAIRIARLFEQDKRFHDFKDGAAAIECLKQKFTVDDGLYIGMFNDKPICAAVVNTDTQKELISHLVMHIENLNRGIEEQFIKLIAQKCQAANKQMVIADSHILDLIEKRVDS